MWVSRPPRLRGSDLVRLSNSALDFEGAHDPYAQVVTFFPVGVVLVVRAGAGVGVPPPEDLVAVGTDDLPAWVSSDIARRRGLDGRP